jgi:hypothetical protein
MIQSDEGLKAENLKVPQLEMWLQFSSAFSAHRERTRLVMFDPHDIFAQGIIL